MRDVQAVRIISFGEDGVRGVDDEVVVEEPLEIRLNSVSLAVTMRTPGDDFDLAAGFLWTEGFIESVGDIGTMAYCPNEEEPHLKNIVNVTAKSIRPIESSRRTWANSSCGICGTTTIDSISRDVKPVESPLFVEKDVLIALPDRMRAEQKNFDRTGGIHAAGLFDAKGTLLSIREDLGRHNAVDKVLGSALRAATRTSETILMVSGRLGFEIAQKAVAAGVPVLASVSAPSSLAIALTEKLGVTAVGFVRGNSMNIYTHSKRIIHGLSKHSS